MSHVQVCDEGTSLSTPALVSLYLYGTDRKIVKDENKHHGAVDESSLEQQFHKPAITFVTSGCYGREGGRRRSHEILVD